MSFRNNNMNRRNNNQNGNFNNNNNNNYGGTISRNNVNPWDGPNMGANNMGGGGRGGGNNDALALANNLLNNLFRNQNQSNVPSLLDMAGPRGGGYNHDGPRGYNNDFRVSKFKQLDPRETKSSIHFEFSLKIYRKKTQKLIDKIYTIVSRFFSRCRF